MTTMAKVREAAALFPEYSRAAELAVRLSSWAMYMAARYNGPVYLVGSALRVGNPRDIDIRIVIADDEFCARYGFDHYDRFCIDDSERWIDDLAKRNGELAKDFRINADFQVYPASNCIQFRDKPSLLLAAPSNLDHIAACTLWWDDPEAWAAKQPPATATPEKAAVDSSLASPMGQEQA